MEHREECPTGSEIEKFGRSPGRPNTHIYEWTCRHYLTGMAPSRHAITPKNGRSADTPAHAGLAPSRRAQGLGRVRCPEARVRGKPRIGDPSESPRRL